MAKRPARTVLEVAVARGGILKGTRVMAFVASWTIASQQLGRPITLDEYMEWWKEARTTAYRHQQRFREIFPELDTPQPIANRAITKQREKLAEKGVQAVGDVSAAGLLA